MKRNRQETTQSIVDSARRFLIEYGFREWGVNQVARYSGFDKVLLYRYFNDLDGLLATLVEDFAFWPEPGTLPEPPADFLEASFRWMLTDPFRLKVYQSISEFPASLQLQAQFLDQRRDWCRALSSLLQGRSALSFAEFCADSLLTQAAWHPHEPLRNPWDLHPEDLVPRSRPTYFDSGELPTELL